MRGKCVLVQENCQSRVDLKVWKLTNGRSEHRVLTSDWPGAAAPLGRAGAAHPITGKVSFLPVKWRLPRSMWVPNTHPTQPLYMRESPEIQCILAEIESPGIHQDNNPILTLLPVKITIWFYDFKR